MSIAIVLANECLSAHSANKRSSIRMGAKVGAKIVCSSEPLWAQAALKSGRVLFDAGGGRPVWVSEFKIVVSVRD